jgi:hypothetical protein
MPLGRLGWWKNDCVNRASESGEFWDAFSLYRTHKLAVGVQKHESELQSKGYCVDYCVNAGGFV